MHVWVSEVSEDIWAALNSEVLRADEGDRSEHGASPENARRPMLSSGTNLTQPGIEPGSNNCSHHYFEGSYLMLEAIRNESGTLRNGVTTMMCKVHFHRRMNKANRPAVMSMLHLVEEYTMCIQADLDRGFQKCSVYRQRPIPFRRRLGSTTYCVSVNAVGLGGSLAEDGRGTYLHLVGGQVVDVVAVDGHLLQVVGLLRELARLRLVFQAGARVTEGWSHACAHHQRRQSQACRLSPRHTATRNTTLHYNLLFTSVARVASKVSWCLLTPSHSRHTQQEPARRSRTKCHVAQRSMSGALLMAVIVFQAQLAICFLSRSGRDIFAFVLLDSSPLSPATFPEITSTRMSRNTSADGAEGTRVYVSGKSVLQPRLSSRSAATAVITFGNKISFRGFTSVKRKKAAHGKATAVVRDEELKLTLHSPRECGRCWLGLTRVCDFPLDIEPGQTRGQTDTRVPELSHSPGQQPQTPAHFFFFCEIIICANMGISRHDGNTARFARRSDETLGVLVSVARIAPSLLDLGRGVTTGWISYSCERTNGAVEYVRDLRQCVRAGFFFSTCFPEIRFRRVIRPNVGCPTSVRTSTPSVTIVPVKGSTPDRGGGSKGISLFPPEVPLLQIAVTTTHIFLCGTHAVLWRFLHGTQRECVRRWQHVVAARRENSPLAPYPLPPPRVHNFFRDVAPGGKQRLQYARSSGVPPASSNVTRFGVRLHHGKKFSSLAIDGAALRRRTAETSAPPHRSLPELVAAAPVRGGSRYLLNSSYLPTTQYLLENGRRGEPRFRMEATAWDNGVPPGHSTVEASPPPAMPQPAWHLSLFPCSCQARRRRYNTDEVSRIRENACSIPRPANLVSSRVLTREELNNDGGMFCIVSLFAFLPSMVIQTGGENIRGYQTIRHPPRRTRFHSRLGLPDFRTWESCRTMPLVAGLPSLWDAVGSGLKSRNFRRCWEVTVNGLEELLKETRVRQLVQRSRRGALSGVFSAQHDRKSRPPLFRLPLTHKREAGRSHLGRPALTHIRSSSPPRRFLPGSTWLLLSQRMLHSTLGGGWTNRGNLAASAPTSQTRLFGFDSQLGVGGGAHTRIFACGYLDGRCRWSMSFLGKLFSRLIHSVTTLSYLASNYISFFKDSGHLGIPPLKAFDNRGGESRNEDASALNLLYNRWPTWRSGVGGGAVLLSVAGCVLTGASLATHRASSRLAIGPRVAFHYLLFRFGGAAVAERLDCSPPNMANLGFEPRPGRSRIFASGCRAGGCRCSAGFPRGSPVSPRLCIPAPLHSRLVSPSTALKISLARGAQISQLSSPILELFLVCRYLTGTPFYIAHTVSAVVCGCLHSRCWPIHKLIGCGSITHPGIKPGTSLSGCNYIATLATMGIVSFVNEFPFVDGCERLWHGHGLTGYCLLRKIPHWLDCRQANHSRSWCQGQVRAGNTVDNAVADGVRTKRWARDGPTSALVIGHGESTCCFQR
ncbi:hypothetical protein PR048_000352 [Dryococelus australis]|uniref:Uncharacterized protein n=1 Tax=Dryococelus australis TaxID=614101 RepID=A0ABQ9IFJ2_9NEOP|nr:hypothetical protein PR048_000352 [Dryococelus australis]